MLKLLRFPVGLTICACVIVLDTLLDLTIQGIEFSELSSDGLFSLGLDLLFFDDLILDGTLNSLLGTDLGHKLELLFLDGFKLSFKLDFALYFDSISGCGALGFLVGGSLLVG